MQFQRPRLFNVLVLLFSILSSFVLFYLGMFFVVESYFAPSPYIDTVFAEKFTWEKWEKIREGMHVDQVHDLLGTPLSAYDGHGGYYGVKSGEDFTDKHCETYSDDGACSWWDFAWISMNVCYDEKGIVLGKNEIINYN